MILVHGRNEVLYLENNNSILTSIKKLLGITKDQTDFDTDIIIHINTALTILNELGVGPEEGFLIEDASATWDNYIVDKRKFDKIKTYIYLKVRLYFDPPQNSTLIESIKQQISELEWRLNTSAENTTE